MLALVGGGSLGGLGGLGALSRPSAAHPDDGGSHHPDDSEGGSGDGGSSTSVVENFGLVGRGERLLSRGTTDVWVHDGYAYLGTSSEPCGTGDGFGEDGLRDAVDGPGIAVFDVHSSDRPEYVGSLPSVEGSRSNDVKVAAMNAGAILVHSNEPCGGGPGGFEVYGVDDPTAPEHLASVQTDDANSLLRGFGVVDIGVHNLWLFTQGARDYVAAVVNCHLGNFQVFDITDPTNPAFVSAWGAEFLATDICRAKCRRTLYGSVDVALIVQLQDYLRDGFGTSSNRYLHDVTVSEDGTRAYLSNWDAGLVLLDIGDPADPRLVSVALDPSAGDGEVNSHAAWPSADGTVVVETNEDFDPFTFEFSVDGEAFPGREGTFTSPIIDLPDGTMSGSTTYLGLACEADDVPDAPVEGGIAVVQRGACPFSLKAQNALDAGYTGIVVFNDEERGDQLVPMGGNPVDVPGVFVGHATGLEIFDVDDVDDLEVGDTGDPVEASVEHGRWGNVRIWDYTDETNPVLASEFDTVCSADPGDDGCDPRGTYSVHNVVVEDDIAYLSWYSNGMLAVDVGDPYDPVELARYNPRGDAFEEQNGGIQDLWGVHKEPGSPRVYGSDRNGGLYVLELLDSGSG